MNNKILLAEDDLFLGKLSQKKFELAGFEVIFLKDGVDVFKLAKAENPDMIVLDLVMPQKDGFQVIKELKTDEATKNIPVIVVSALGSDEDKARVKKLGAIKYFVKSEVQIAEIVAYLKKI